MSERLERRVYRYEKENAPDLDRVQGRIFTLGSTYPCLCTTASRPPGVT